MQIDTPPRPHPPFLDSVPGTGSHRGEAARYDPGASTSAALSVATRAVLEADAAITADPAAERALRSALYAAVVARVLALRDEGLRPERVLVTLKRETYALLDAMALGGTPIDGRRGDEVLRHVVRWSVEAYHRAD